MSGWIGGWMKWWIEGRYHERLETQDIMKGWKPKISWKVGNPRYYERLKTLDIMKVVVVVLRYLWVESEKLV